MPRQSLSSRLVRTVSKPPTPVRVDWQIGTPTQSEEAKRDEAVDDDGISSARALLRAKMKALSSLFSP